MEEAGFVTFARRGRVVAGDLLRTVDALRAERSARTAVQEARDAAVALLAERAYHATGP